MRTRTSSLTTIDDDFVAIDRLLRELRNRIADAAEVVRVAASKAAKTRRKSAAPSVRGRVKAH